MRRSLSLVLLVQLFLALMRTEAWSEKAIRDTARASFRKDGARVRFRATPRLPGAEGEARMRVGPETTALEVEFDDMKPAALFGGDYTTYVLWIVTEGGRLRNAGEVVLEGDSGRLNVAAGLESFGILVTAEPHCLVKQPSEFVVLELDGAENIVRYQGSDEIYNYERDTLAGVKEARGPVLTGMKQAFMAVRLAQRARADELASTEMIAARESLRELRAISQRSHDRTDLEAQARDTVRLAFAAEQAANEVNSVTQR